MNNFISFAMGMFNTVRRSGVNPLQLLNIIQGKGDPAVLMSMMANMFGKDPNFQRAQQMLNGKSPAEMQQIVQNMCKEAGVDYNSVRTMGSKFGLKL